VQPSDITATRVGAALSLLLLLSVVLVLRVDFGDVGPAVNVRVYLAHPGPLRTSADVQLAGRRIGRVERVQLVTANQARAPEHLLHPAGGVVLSLAIKKKYVPWVRRNSELFVNSKGLIGESYLEVAPPPASEEMLVPVQEGDKVRGIDPARMEEIIVTSFLNAKRFGALLDELSPSMNQLRAELDQLTQTLSELTQESGVEVGDAIAFAGDEFQTLRKTFAEAASDGLASPSDLRRKGAQLATRARRDFASLSIALDALGAQLQRIKGRVPPDLFAKFDVAIARARQSLAQLETTIAKVDQLASQVASGIGTVGALMNDKEFSDDAKKLGRYIKRHPWELVTRPIDN
tara:strand:- start:56629 stop:57672 length:1044 start_codon:yes stop_codon:yes gene_type:complete